MSNVHRRQLLIRNGAFVLVAVFTAALYGWLHGVASVASVPLLMAYLVSVNVVTWLYFAYDKRIAGKPGYVRVPENTFFILAVAGGLPSTLLAMKVFRHKSAKRRFKWMLFGWSVVAYACAGAAVWWFAGVPE